MDLTSFATTYLGKETGGVLHGAGPDSMLLYDIVRSEVHTDPLIATLFWQIFMHTSSYACTLLRAGASSQSVAGVETTVVCHGEGFSPRYDLVVFDPAYGKNEPTGIPIEAPHEELVEGWKLWKHRRRSQWNKIKQSKSNKDFDEKFIKLVDNVGPGLAIEAAKNKPFGILVTRPPVIQKTSVPSPPWGVASSAGGTPTSTAGAIVRNSQGRSGVTIAMHAPTEAGVIIDPGVTNVEVNGITGTIRSMDSISDSCFVEIPQGVGVGQYRRTRGPLAGVSPRANEQVHFEGIASGSHSAKVTGWSPDIPFVLRYNQLKVLTTAVTAPGDSGAAALDGDDHILGFSFWRTGLGEDPEFSAWIWADSVYKAHGLFDL